MTGCRGLLDLDDLDFARQQGGADAGSAGATGAIAFAIGILPVEPGWNQSWGRQCPDASDRLDLSMDDENSAGVVQPNCSGQGPWQEPAEVKEMSCGPASSSTKFSFCRVDGRAFKPRTADPLDVANHYAVLKMGEYCPDDSVEVSRYIHNEDDNNANTWTGPIFPNLITKGPPPSTTLVFCLFRGGSSTMAAFPDLGVSYAVFHDFDVEQPGWVLSKKWLRSDDENFNNESHYVPPSGPTQVDLVRIVEAIKSDTVGVNDTVYDVARVH